MHSKYISGGAHTFMCIVVRSQFLEIDSSMMNFSVMHPCNNFGLWTVNKKSEECVTLHSDFLEMSYELKIKIKFLAPLLLGDF